MHGKSLYEFYEKFLLPQFDIIDVAIKWEGSEDVGPDEVVHYFKTASDDYALIFEDADGFGRTEEFVRENVRLKGDSFEFVYPTSYTHVPPSYPVNFPTTYHYCVNITGTFTLIKM